MSALSAAIVPPSAPTASALVEAYRRQGRGSCAVDRRGFDKTEARLPSYPRMIRGGSDDDPSPAKVFAEAKVFGDR